MPNGHAALHLVPAPAAQEETIEAQIGAATASAACALAAALEHGGPLPDILRLTAGERIGRLYELQQAYGNGFEAVARDRAKYVMLSYFDSAFFQRHGAAGADQALDFFIDQILLIVNRVAEHERALAH
jgi:hypothetical protein